jgi:hypothetical protein
MLSKYHSFNRVLFLVLLLVITAVLSTATTGLWLQPASRAVAMPANLAGTIAYVHDTNQIRLIEADGSNDRTAWQTPNPGFGAINGLDWKPDATALAFTSDFEGHCSLRQADLFTVNNDGTNLRRVTLGPLCSQLAAYPKGTVTVRVVNHTFDVGMVFVYVQGAPDVYPLSIAPGMFATVTIPNVADLGVGVNQAVVAKAGFQTWVDPATAIDVIPNQTVHAGDLTLSNNNKAENWGATSPSWRRDSNQIGFSVGSVGLHQISPTPPLGAFGDLITVAGNSLPPGAIAFSPFSDEILYYNIFDSIIYRATPGQAGPPEGLVNLDGFSFIGMDWLPDGSGFIFAQYSSFYQQGNLFEYSFAGPTLTQLTHNDNFSGLYDYHPSVSPDGQHIVYVHWREGSSPTLQIRNRDGSQVWPLGVEGEFPSWGTTAVAPPPGGASHTLFLPSIRR